MATQVLNVMSNEIGHDVIEFDTETGQGVEKAMKEFWRIVAEQKATPMTRPQQGSGDFHLIRQFNQAQAETNFMVQKQAG